MRIAIVINTSWNIFNFRMSLIKTLIANNIEVYAIAPRDDYSEQLMSNGCRFIPLIIDNTGSNPVKDFRLTFRLASIYRKVRPDLILHYTIKPNVYGTLAASLFNIPVINNVSGLGTVFLEKSRVSQVAMMLYHFAFRFPKKIFFQNEWDRQLFISRKLVKQEQTEVLPGSGVDLKKFAYQPFKRNGEFTFLLISRLLYDKGIREYVEAIKDLKSKKINARFQLLGALDPAHRRGISAKILKKWQQDHQIEYLGVTDDVRPFINKADCVVLPSYREGTPKTLLEAASLGKPLIATDVPGCNNVVENNYNGFLCMAKEPADLAKKMHAMLMLDDENLKAMGQNSRKKVEKEYDERLVIEKYLKAIKEILQGKIDVKEVLNLNRNSEYRRQKEKTSISFNE